jgi:1A family penicillin-binding protein
MYIFSPKNLAGNSKLKKLWDKINWKFMIKIFFGFFLAGILGVAGVFAYFAKDLPSPGKLNERKIIQSTKIYDRTGNHILYEVHGEEKRTEIPFSEMPDTLKFATIALEDQDFYNHHGIKFSGIARALFKDVLRGDKAQGGSTITQQLIKLSLLTSEKTFTRKIKEVILALELETKFEKDVILGMYLNEIPYGSNAYGAEAAAQTFFGKHARELSLDESAILASLPQAPSRYSPYGSRTETLKARQEHALDQMARLGYITKEQSEEAKQMDVFSKIKPHARNIKAPHFVMYIKEYLENKYGELELEQGGLKVYTTLDWDKQQIAESAIRNHAEKNATQYSAHNSSLVAMDPKNGQILAMVGSKDYFGSAYPEGCVSGKNCKFEGNFNVAIANRQPGSSMKPYVYLAAFSKGYTPETQLWDVDTNFSTDDGKDYSPRNYDGKNHGLVKMKDALAMSLNIPAVKTLYLAGVKDSITLAKNMGISTLNEPDRYGLSLVLGGGEVKLYEHVNAFSTFATGGIHHKKTAILKIEDGSGNILEQFESNSGERIIEEKYVAMIDHTLSTNSLRAPVFGENNPLRFDSRPVAVKTGTTNEWRDGWTIGYTPSLVAGVWTGNNDNTIMKPGSDGSYVAAPIWREFMENALKNYDIEQFPKYEKEETGKDILDGKLDSKVKLKVCKIPNSKDDYCIANDYCPEKERDEKTFSNSHNILHYVDKNDPRGDQPENPKKDSQYKRWEEAVKNYIKDNKKEYGNGAPPEDECKEDDFKKYKPSISIKSPTSGSTVNPIFNIEVRSDSPFGVSEMKILVDGEEKRSGSDSSLNYSHDASGKIGGEIEIEAIVRDKKGNTDSKKITVSVMSN